MNPVLLDTSVIVALLDRSENLHEACAETAREWKAPLITWDIEVQLRNTKCAELSRCARVTPLKRKRA